VDHFAAFVLGAHTQWTAPASVGGARFDWVLQHVSFVNQSARALGARARGELERATARKRFETMKNDAAGLPPQLPLFGSLAEQAAATAAGSKTVKEFLATTGLLKLPNWLTAMNYTVAAIPEWLAYVAELRIGLSASVHCKRVGVLQACGRTTSTFGCGTVLRVRPRCCE
jgi:hypothetical protein